mmetsp:Transcript_45184/g.110040  ORF Transcript_45184/g.110040 Transcript_45184/m.110040 type:complete len:612 (+) Transcript_45184:802-2637(+)
MLECWWTRRRQGYGIPNNDNDSNRKSISISSHIGGDGDGVAKVKTSPEDSSVFDSFGVLEHILSFVDTQTLLNATLVTRRFKKAGRHDDLWIKAIKRLWKDKKGVYYDSFSEHGVAAAVASASALTKPPPRPRTTNQNPDSLPNLQHQSALQQPYNNLIFWRSLFAKELVEKMTEEQIRCFLFGHPLLQWKSNQFEQQQLASTSAKTSEMPPVTGTSLLCSVEQQQQKKEEGRPSSLQRFVQLHMLDIMSDLTSEEVQQSVFASAFGGNEGDESDDFDDDDDDSDDDYSDDNEDTSNGFDDDDGDMINTRQRQIRREQEQRRQRRTQRQRALPRRHFFSDLYFGSYACSVMDSYRCRLTQIELCRPYGWLLYFKVDANELLEDLLEHPRDDDDGDDDEEEAGEMILNLMDDDEDHDRDDENGSDDEEEDDDDDGDFNYAHAAARRGCLEVYERNPQILLYKHSFCYFDTPESTNGGVSGKDGISTQSSDFFGNTNRGRKFRMEVLDHVENIVSSDLQWRWAVNGSKVQVGPYPPLKVKRRSDDWGWELENQHVVMRSLEYDRQHPEPRRSLPEVFVHAIADAESERDRRRRQRRRRRRFRDRHRQRHQARP